MQCPMDQNMSTDNATASVQVELSGEAAWLYKNITPKMKTKAIQTALLIIAEDEREIVKFIPELAVVNCIIGKKKEGYKSCYSCILL